MQCLHTHIGSGAGVALCRLCCGIVSQTSISGSVLMPYYVVCSDLLCKIQVCLLCR